MPQEKEHSSGRAEINAQGLRIIDQVDDTLWACDLDINLTYLNPATKTNGGFSAAERMQLTIDKILTPDSLASIQALIKQHSATRRPDEGPDTPARCLIDIYRKDGSTYPAEASISFTRNDAGELTGLVGSNRNIAERVRAETIIKAIHDGTIHITGEQYLSNLVCHLSKILDQRYTFIAQINAGISQTLAFCKDGKISDNFSYSLEGSPCENVVAGDICYYPKNATQVFPHEEGMKRMGVESYIGTPIPDATGQVQGLLVIMHDQPMEDIPLLTRVLEVCADRVGAEMSRRKIQGQLKESEQRFRALFEQSIDPCFIHNSEGVIIGANKSLELAFGYSQEELRLLNATQLSSSDPDVRMASRAEFKKVVKTGASRYETRLRRKSGVIFPAEATSQLINIEGQELAQTVIRDLTEQHRLRDQVDNTQQTLAKLFSAMHTMIAMLDTDGRVTYANSTERSNPDAMQANLSTQALWDYQAFSHDPAMQSLIKESIAFALKGQNAQADIQILSPHGLFWMQINVNPIRDDNGRITQLLVEGTDIDQRKKMAEQILAEEKRRKLFREQAPMPVIEWNTDNYTLTEWNDAAEALFGFTFEDMKGQLPDFLTPQGIAVDKKDIHQTLSSTHNKVISKNRCKDGRILLCEWYNSPIKDVSDAVIAVVSIVRDITAEHQAQQMLLDREAEQREILNTMLDAVFTLDQTGTVLSFNSAAEKLWGYQSSEIIGQACWSLIADPYVKQHHYYMQRYIETLNPKFLGVSKDIKGKCKDGSTFPSRMSIAALGNKVEERQHFIVSMQDLSHTKQQEEKLRRSLKMDALGKLTGGIAHDFNNMLGIIIGYTDLLQAAVKDQPKIEQYAEEIFRASQRGAQLTEKLLGFSRQKLAVAQQLFINTALQDQRHMLTKAITPRIALHYDLTENIWPVYLDSGDFLDAILNISINAMHAMPDGGQLSIATANETISELDALLKGIPKGDYVLLSISDTGCGMDQEIQEKIFDPFFSTKGELGTGLGLSQVYGFVERSNGCVRIYSEPDHGTRISLYFPRHLDIESQTSNQAQSTPALNHSGQETILVVDDEAALLNLSTEMLRQQGYKVIPVGSGQEALEVLKNTTVNLLLSDILMPGMDGYQLAAEVQAHYPAVKIQLASGFTDDRHSEKLDAKLIDNILQKPFSIKAVLTRIRSLLDE